MEVLLSRLGGGESLQNWQHAPTILVGLFLIWCGGLAHDSSIQCYRPRVQLPVVSGWFF